MPPLDGPPAPDPAWSRSRTARGAYWSARRVFTSSPKPAPRRLLPDGGATAGTSSRKNRDDEDPAASLYLAMEHGAVSPDGRLIVVGEQASTHLVFDNQLEQVADIGNPRDYPHHAAFSADGGTAVFNSCHFYNGTTIGVPTAALPGLTTEMYGDDERTPVLEDGARVYASAVRGGRVPRRRRVRVRPGVQHPGGSGGGSSSWGPPSGTWTFPPTGR